MTISSTTRKAGPYTGNAITTVFPFAFKVFATSDVLVVQTDLSGIETPQTLTSNYTVSLNADQNASPGGNVTMLIAPPTGFKLTIASQVSELQGLSLTNGGAFDAGAQDDAFDRAVILVQQHAEKLGRTMAFPISDVNPVTALPGAVSRSLQFLGFDAAGNPVAASAVTGVLASAFMQTVLGAASAIVARSTLGADRGIQPIDASVASNALTLTLNPTTLDFRSATLGSGTINTRTVAAVISVVVPSTATLGTVSAIQSRLALLAIDNAGTVELAVINSAGAGDLTETGVISTTAISAAATLSYVAYSTTARSNVPYRVVGYVESTQATAGTWATAPSTIQGYGGQAFSAWSSLGYGQTWQSVIGSRSSGVTYYNTTGKPIGVSVSLTAGVSGGISGVVNSVTVSNISYNGTGGAPGIFFIVPIGGSYAVTATTATIAIWVELR